MTKHILQVNYKISLTPGELTAKAVERAEAILESVSGLEWKMFLVNNEGCELGGIYLFSNEESLEAYLDSSLFAAVKNNPLISEISVKKFTNIEKATAITHGPL